MHALWEMTLAIVMIGQPTQCQPSHYDVLASLSQPLIFFLETMETTRFFLRTGFGESKTLYGGTHEQ
jgi:hypothetical protein